MKLFGHHVRSTTMLMSLLESAIFILAFLAAHRTLNDAPYFDPAAGGAFSDFLAFAILPAAVLYVIFCAFGAYRPDAQSAIQVMAQRLLIGGVAGGLVILVVFAIFFPAATVPTTVSLAVGGAVAITLLLRIGVRGAALEAIKPRVLVLGVGKCAENIRALCKTKGSSRIVTFVEPQAQTSSNAVVPEDCRSPMPDSLAEYAQKLGVSEIVVALDNRRGAFPAGDLIDCRMRGVQVVDASSYIEKEIGQVDLDNLYPSWLIFSSGFRRSYFDAPAKRLIDIVCSLGLLVLLAPVLLVTAIAIMLDSPGGVFYRQERVGLNGKPFFVLKFRSMRNDAEVGGAKWAAKNDPRVTRVGAFIRKTRIDEIPQTINVLKGQMSFVGPRPERQVFVNELSEVIPYYNERHRVKPGITGWAQINYPYGASIEDSKEKLKYDLYYMKNYSIFLDLVIVVQTVRTILFAEGGR
ncbi:MAG: TIGR03013 family XrtA/PEP-CTERM system glycosyltransferase [Pseudomonadota bacterium]